MAASMLVLILAGVCILAERSLVAAQGTTNEDPCLAFAITPDADLRRWLSSAIDPSVPDPNKAFQSALQNDLPSCIKDASSSQYGLLTDIMTTCTDRYQYPDLLSDSTLYSKDATTDNPAFKQSSTQSHPSCGCTPACKSLLSSITPECWQQMFDVFCSYEIRSGVVGASLQSVYNQLTTRQCYTKASPAAPLTCDQLSQRQDPRNDIRINDVANDSTGLKAVMWASLAAALLSLAIVL